MMKYFLLLIFLTAQLSAKADFDFNANCVNAYESILSLRINEAKALIQKEKQQNPQNAITILLDNYVTYFSLLTSESKTDYEKQKELRAARITALEKQDKNSPYYLFSQAEIYLQWALLKGRFGDYVSSAMDLNRAKNLLKENATKYPEFIPNKKGLAIISVIFGSVPSNLKKTLQFVGIKGDSAAGIRQLQQLRAELPKTKYSYYKDEVVFLLCYIDIDILHHHHNYNQLITYVGEMENNSLLKVYLQGYVAAKTGHNAKAIAFLENNTIKNSYEDFPALSYLLGNAKLNRMDSDAHIYLLRYLKDYKGINYIKDTYLKLAYYYLLKNDQEKFSYYIQQVRTKGYTVDEKDKQALREGNDVQPDTSLLRARFYFDGAEYPKALAQLKNKDVNDFKLLRDKTEFNYRLGRIYEETDQFKEALVNYQKAIYAGKNTGYYYAANAALKIGEIFEQQKEFKRAAFYYQQAIDMKDHEYETSIENQAREGLKRMAN
ncbi:MAG: tetratricopeptide repeat protein [Sphingobacteriaceae bacterium]